MARGYFATRISENLEETPEGFLIARGCVIGRTGVQTYAVSDLPQESAADLGVDLSNPRADIDLFRVPEEVFSAKTLASAEGKAVTDNHPDAGFVTPENFTQFARGHIQNVRKGTEPLDSGDWPMIADVIVTAEPLLSKVKNNLARELSLGYEFSIERVGDQIRQVDMVINHCAVVPKGRAGPEARIMDAAPEPQVSSEEIHATPPEPAASPPEPSAGHVAPTPTTLPTKKEKPKVKNNILHLLGLGLRAKAADEATDPEELAQAAMDVGKFKANDESDEDEVMDKKAKDRKAKDAEDPTFKEPEDEDRESAADAMHRKTMHDALDDFLDQQEGGDLVKDRRKKASDADLEELKGLLSKFFTEEEKEPEHEAADTTELDEALGGAPPEEPVVDEEMCKCGDPECPGCEAMDMEEEVESGEEELEPVMDRAKAADRKGDRAGAVDGAKAVLKRLRPVVARTGDAAVVNAFNAALTSVSKSSRASTGSYGGFASAARTRSKAADASATDHIEARNARLQAAYNQSLKEGK